MKFYAVSIYYYLWIEWSALSFASILPIWMSFFSGFQIIFRIRFYWYCCAPHLIYVYQNCYLCSRVLFICCFGHFWAIGEPIFHYKTNKISINKRIKFHFTVIQNEFVKLIGNVCDHKNYHETRLGFFSSNFNLRSIEISVLVKWRRQYETRIHEMYISMLFCGLNNFYRCQSQSIAVRQNLNILLLFNYYWKFTGKGKGVCAPDEKIIRRVSHPLSNLH